MLNRNCRACQSNGNGSGNNGFLGNGNNGLTGNGNNGLTGNGSGNTTSSRPCKDKIRQLQKIDFSMVDTILYLNAYPESREALEYYHKLHGERKRLLEQMSAEGCSAVCNMDSTSRGEWNWVNSPWPWEFDAN